LTQNKEYVLILSCCDMVWMRTHRRRKLCVLIQINIIFSWHITTWKSYSLDVNCLKFIVLVYLLTFS